MQRELVEQAMHGNHHAFAELATAAIGRLYGTAGLTLRNHAQDEAVQNALIHAWRDLPRLRDPDRFDAWLRRLLVHACTDELRRCGRHRAEIALDNLDVLAIADGAVALADRDQLQRGFARLTDDYRTVLALRFYLDLPLAEVAHALSVPIGTVKSRLNRALQGLRAELAASERAAEGRMA